MNIYNSVQRAEVLVIGCGVAGSTTALMLADAGVPVVVVTRARKPEDSNTYMAQGGIVYHGKDDSPALLAEDIVRAGAGHSDPTAVNILAEQGSQAVHRVLLERVGVPFDRTGEGQLSLALEGGHTRARILHATDATGRAIEISLLNALAAHPNVRLLTGHTVVELCTDEPAAGEAYGTCLGAYVLDQDSGRTALYLARVTVLAAGGVGQIFLRTTNARGTRGDGVAMAARAGARILDAEYMQFHPTAFYHDGDVHFLVSEAVRGAGARLVHADGEPFMQHYDESWRDLAPRDVVARSIHWEMQKRGVENVYLDLRSYVSPEEIRGHFPTIYARCLEFGIDATRDLVPVVPAAHYFCGGVAVDEWGRTDLPRLYAVGEVACTGLHGANRLASTSLLEGLVWGERAAQHIEGALDAHPAPHQEDAAHFSHSGTQKPDDKRIESYRRTIGEIMWQHVGLVRTGTGLEKARQQLQTLEAEISEFYREAQLTDELIAIRNMVRTALLVTDAAYYNTTNLGCHYREDSHVPVA